MVNDSLLYFDTLFDQVLTDSFHQTLPTIFKDFSTPLLLDPEQPQHDTSHRPKRQRFSPHFDKSKERLVNPKQIDA